MADLVIARGKIVNVLTGEVYEGDIAAKRGVIIGIGDVGELVGADTKVVEGDGCYVAPGFIDAHVHFESSMVTLTHFARCVLRHGTTSVIIDPHELANVLGARGVKWVLEEAERLPLNVFVMVPSCVPATEFETSGARISLLEAKELFEHPGVIGLGEMMDYPQVVAGKEERLELIEAAIERGLRVDGHCPGLRGRELWRYVLAGVSSDHESLTSKEALEKARLGMRVMLRGGSASNELSFLKHLLREGVSLENFLLASDDTNPHELVQGHMDRILREAIRLGVDPIDAIAMCTINTARHYRLDDSLGSISIGRRCDLVILESLERVKVKEVIAGGLPLCHHAISSPEYPQSIFETVKCREVLPGNLVTKADKREGRVRVRVIQLTPGRIFTEKATACLPVKNTVVEPDPAQDILALAVVERHGKNNNIATGFIQGFGLKHGAFAQSIAHDSHNIIAVGASATDMALCVNAIRRMQGGIAVGVEDRLVSWVRLPFAGLLSLEPVGEVASQVRSARDAIRGLGCSLASPISLLSFMALPVVPRLKLTDKGLFDTDEFRHVPVIIE